MIIPCLTASLPHCLTASLPHCHARHSGDKARIEIASGGILDGRLSPRFERLVREWVRRHQPELEHNWPRAREMRPLERIEPLP